MRRLFPIAPASLVISIIRYHRIIGKLARTHLKQQYAATVVGSMWGIIQPLATILVYWFVFSVGLKLESKPGETPYFVSLLVGFLPWLTFVDGLLAGTSSVTNHSYLVKKISFPIEVLPLAPVAAAALTHVVLLGISLLILLGYGIYPGEALLLLPLYLFAMLFLTAGLVLALSAMNVFQRDIGQSLAIITMFWFWLTPIVWPAENVPAKLQLLLTANPMYFIVDGYRSAILSEHISAPELVPGIYFALLSLGLFTLGANLFLRLKPHFADII